MRKYFDSVIDQTGQPIYRAEVRVTDADGDPVQLYSEDGPATLVQPVLTNSLGLFEFYVPDGAYTLTTTYPGAPSAAVVTDVEIYDDSEDRALTARALKVPIGEIGLTLPISAARAGNFLAFDASGNPVVSSGTGTDPALRTDLAASTGSSLVGFIQTGDEAKPRTAYLKLLEIPVTPQDYPLTGTPVAAGYDDYDPMMNAILAGITEKRRVIIPEGTYTPTGKFELRLTDYLSYFSSFAPGPRIRGAGQGRTVILSAVENDYLIDIDTGIDHATGFKGILGLELGGFTIRQQGTPLYGCGIRLRSAYMARVDDIHVVGLTGTGINVYCANGDNDASNMVTFERVRIDSCLGWLADVYSTLNHNEASFMEWRNCFFQAGGTATADYLPSSGGMRWKGQMGRLTLCAFTLNKEVPLYVPAEAATPSNLKLDQVTFENNFRRAGPWIRGITGFVAEGCQMYANDACGATVGWELDAADNIIRDVRIDPVKVRVTSANTPFVAMKVSGNSGNLQRHSIHIAPFQFENFDYTGQSRYYGVNFPKVADCCSFAAETTTLCTLKPRTGEGDTMPLRLRGAGAVPSTTGEWIEYHVPVGGLSIANTGLAANTDYYAYLYDAGTNLANPGAIELSTTAPQIDPGANGVTSGYEVKTGDPTRYFIGGVSTDASSLFKTTGNGWFKPMRIPGSQIPGFMWLDGTTAPGKLRVKYPLRPTSDTDPSSVPQT